MRATTPPFSLNVRPDGVLVVSGEIEAETADEFLTVAVSLADRTREVVLDVGGLAFIDSAGITAIVKLAFEACPHGLVLQSPRNTLQQVLGIVDVEQFAGIRVERTP